MIAGIRKSFGCARPYTGPHRLLKSHAASPQAILVYPGADFEGDVIRPDGGDWRRFEANPVVNLDHGPYIGTGAVALHSIPGPGDSGRVNVPVGISKIFEAASDLRGLNLPRVDARGDVVGRWSPEQCLRIAEQVGPKILDGTLDGVSIELHFEPDGAARLGRLPHMKRDSLKVDRWDGLGYAHTLTPINGNARQVLDTKTDERVEKCLRWRESLPDRAELGYLRKSLTRFVESARPPSTRTTVAMRMTKAMPGAVPPPVDDQDYFADSADEPAGTDAAAPAPDPETPVTPPSVKVPLQLSQSIMDVCQAADAGMTSSDNPTAIGAMRKFTDKLRGFATKLQTFANANGVRLKTGAGDIDDPELADNADDPSDLDDSGDDDGTVEEPTAPDADESGETDDADNAEGADDEAANPFGKKKKKKAPMTDEDGNVLSKSHSQFVPRRIYKSDLRAPVKRVERAEVATAAIVANAADDSRLGAKLDKLISLLSRTRN